MCFVLPSLLLSKSLAVRALSMLERLRTMQSYLLLSVSRRAVDFSERC